MHGVEADQQNRNSDTHTGIHDSTTYPVPFTSIRSNRNYFNGIRPLLVCLRIGLKLVIPDSTDTKPTHTHAHIRIGQNTTIGELEMNGTGLLILCRSKTTYFYNRLARPVSVLCRKEGRAMPHQTSPERRPSSFWIPGGG